MFAFGDDDVQKNAPANSRILALKVIGISGGVRWVGVGVEYAWFGSEATLTYCNSVVIVRRWRFGRHGARITCEKC